MIGLARASIALLLVMWLLGVMFGVGGSMINVLLLLAGLGIEHSRRPVAAGSRNTGNVGRQGLSGTSRSEDKMAA